MAPRKTIRRRTIDTLTDSERYVILKSYAEGQGVKEMAQTYSLDVGQLNKFIQSHLKNMLVVRETNELAQKTNKPVQGNAVVGTISKCLTPAFLSLVEDNAEAYAYYYIQTNDNAFALQQCGLDIGIHKTLSASVKQHILRLRGQYIRDIPAIAQLIREEQDRRMTELNVNKTYVQRELVSQIDELKVISINDARQRSNLLKSIELLGKTIGAFTEHMIIDEGNAKTGLDLLMARVKEEEGLTTYEVEETDTE